MLIADCFPMNAQELKERSKVTRALECADMSALFKSGDVWPHSKTRAHKNKVVALSSMCGSG
jgi:hypothetical protein